MKRVSPAAALLLVTVALAAAAARSSAGQQRGDDAGAQLAIVLAIEDARAPAPDDRRILIQAARSGPLDVRVAAVRALGRLERRDVITDLIPLLAEGSPQISAETANALAQALRGEPLPGDVSGEHVQIVQTALLQAGAGASVRALGAIYRSVGRLPYTRPEQIQAADEFLRRAFDLPRRAQPELHAAVASAARGLESLARLERIARLGDETIERLRRVASRQDTGVSDETRRNASAALATARAYDEETLAAVLTDPDPEVRRVGARALSGAATGFDPEQRHRLIRGALADRAAMVRFEALRAWARQEVRSYGCGPLIDAMRDDRMHVALAAIDLLGDHCPNDDVVTDRLTSEARTPPPFAWHREAHAVVALAKRSRERAALAMPAFVGHQVWQVRTYAARAAAILDDVASLQRLATDKDDNVVEAALPPLRRRLSAESDGMFIAALTRRRSDVGRHRLAHPYQVLRTAAIELKGAAPSPALVTALLRALEHVTSLKQETSRDVRLALIERLRELGSPALVGAFTPLLRDFDWQVAAAAAEAIGAWTGTRPDIYPQPHVRPSPVGDSGQVGGVAIVLGSGRRFEIDFSPDAPLARTRFLRLVANDYYEGLTFHRVEPNFVIQGGSPNANEYVGDGPFMPDELGLAMHTRGAVGISTRGRDTGDAQIFINLVDNPRLDHEYTVFAHVRRTPVDGMEVVDAILEGDVISRVELVKRR
jgi:cyclophilin family peptidyl-prolyl cis-trans isomerase/HEAT repeat protein